MIKELSDRHVASQGKLIFTNVNAARSRSHGHDETRSSSHRGDAWSFPKHQISIRWATQANEVEPSRSSNGDRTAAIKPDSRSRFDHGPIAPRSRLIHRAIEATITAKWWATITVAINPTSQLDQTAAKIGQIFPLKRQCIPPYFLTFDWFVKQLSEFGIKSLVICDSPAFRLNSEAIRARLIANSSLIS